MDIVNNNNDQNDMMKWYVHVDSATTFNWFLASHFQIEDIQISNDGCQGESSLMK